MRILHTSDWHLGIHHGAVSRGPDHDHFLAWLLEVLEEQAIDALIVAGDVFDALQPSSGALRRYYRFLADVAGTGVPQVVVVGGNHDSASRLDAPSEVLEALKVHVVGGIDSTEASWARCLVPLVDRKGEVGAVALAVPYVHEYRLGVRTTDPDAAVVRAAYRDRFGQVYRWLADQALARHPGLPLVATGHLTLGTGARREDYPHAIHQVGSLEGLPLELIDPRIQYTALGHIHRAYPVDEARRIWYSGSPVAFSLPEAAVGRRVLLVDLDPDPAEAPVVTPLAVPTPRGLREVRGAPGELLDALRDLTWEEPLPPLVFARVVADELPPGLPSSIHEALETFAEGARPTLVELRQERATPLGTSEGEEELPPLGDLRPHEVFRRLCEARGRSDLEALDTAFGTLSCTSDEDFQALLAEVRSHA